MAAYTWELGIDWNATEPTGVSYLRGGLAMGDLAMPGTAPVKAGDVVTFRVLDITSSAQPAQPAQPVKWVNEIPYFRIFTQAAVKGQAIDNALSNLQPAFTPDDVPQVSLCFPTDHVSASWTSTQVSVEDHVGRFLLTVNVQAIGSDGITRFFRLDPEMVVGASLHSSPPHGEIEAGASRTRSL